MNLTKEQERTLTLLRRSARWTEQGQSTGEWANLKGLRHGKPTEELFLRRILIELLTLGAVDCEDSQRILDTPFGHKKQVAVRYWQVKG